MAERTFRTAPPYHPGRPVGTPPTARRWRRSADADGPVQTTLVGAGPPPPGPTSRRERRLVGAPSPTDEPAAPISEATPAGPPVAPRINAVAITPLEGPKWSAARAPVQKPAEEVRMRSITTLLTTLLGKTGLLEGDFDYHLLRASMVIIFLFFGYQKWWDYEA